jgi:hypothetical protein
MPVAEKAKLADYVIDNGGDRASTEAQVRDVHAALTAEANVATQLLASDPRRKIAPLGVVFPVNMGNRGQNEIPPGAVFRSLCRFGEDPQFVGYHWRRSGNFLFVRPDPEAGFKAVAALSSVTKLESISRSFSALVKLDWRIPIDAKTTRGGSVVVGDASGSWRLIAVFLSEGVRPEKRIVGHLAPRIKVLAWPSAQDVLCAYQRPGEAGDVGQVTRAAVVKLRSITMSPQLFGSGRAVGVVRDILCGRNLRDGARHTR